MSTIINMILKTRAGLALVGLISMVILLVVESAKAEYSKNSIIRSGGESRSWLSLTIYNQNYGLIREERKVAFSPEESQEVLFMDVPAQIEPETVFIETQDREIKILEQKFEYDLITQENLLKQYVGKQLKILTENPKTGEKSLLEAELVSYHNNQPIYQIKGEIYLGYPAGTLVLPKIPEQMVARPTLRWLVKNSLRKAQEKPIVVSYLSRGLNWTANYLLRLDQKAAEGNLFSWVTIDNQSGVTFPAAKIKLVAGEVKRAEEVRYGIRRKGLAAESLEVDTAAQPSPFREEALAEYHLYTLDKPSTLKDQQTTQISFIEATKIPIQKEYIFLGEGIYQRSQRDLPQPPPRPTRVYLKLENRKEHHLGLPLPQGVIRVYQAAAGSGASRTHFEFIGEDRLMDTPPDETVRIQIGSAFDVLGVQKQMEWQKVAAQVYESSWQVELRNRRDEKVVVQVIEPVQGEWKILSSSHPYERLEAYKIGFSVPVPARGEAKLTYRIRVEF
ncbi:MAG: DUF4139 domain-containing protein [bacterium]|nr:DUF4139 domain-containing protein [bacterium]